MKEPPTAAESQVQSTGRKLPRTIKREIYPPSTLTVKKVFTNERRNIPQNTKKTSFLPDIEQNQFVFDQSEFVLLHFVRGKLRGWAI